jgi:hypothetical protein
MMPGMDGLELLRSLRADSRSSQIPIILLSARAGDESKVEGLDAGADDYLVKPFTARELRARVKSHLNIARERRRFAQQLSIKLSELERANCEIRDARRAALNVLEDAVEERERAKQLHAKLEEQAHWLNGQSRALEAVVKNAPMATSLGILVRTATDALGRDTRAAFYIGNGPAAPLRHVIGMPDEYAAELVLSQVGPSSSVLDVHEDPRWESWRCLAERFGYRCAWSFPITTSSGRFAGAMVIYLAQVRKPDLREMELAELLTNTASLIISRHEESAVRRRAGEPRHES